MKEVEAYNLFRHSPHIIHSIDHCVAADRGSGGGGSDDSKTVYVLLPYYRRGNLQDLINANLVNHTRFPEKRLMLLFLGVCRGMKDMHQYRPRPERMEAAPSSAPDAPKPKSKSKGKRRADAAPGADEDHETEQQAPLMAGEDDSGRTPSGAIQSYAHRDIKPGPPPPPLTHPPPKSLTPNRKHHDFGLGRLPDPHGPRLPRRLPAAHHLALARRRHARRGRRALDDAVPRAGAV